MALERQLARVQHQWRTWTHAHQNHGLVLVTCNLKDFKTFAKLDAGLQLRNWVQ
jgi:hypothetical protein